MSELPVDLDSIDLTWLAAALGIDGARLLGYRRGQHAGGFAVTSLVARLHLDFDRPDSAAPRSVIAKFPNPDFTRTQANCEAEIDFYTRIASRMSLPVPRCFYGAYDSASGRSVLLLEDLTDARPGHPGDQGCDRLQAQAALTALARMQAAAWRSRELERLGLPRRPLFGGDLQHWLSDTEQRFADLRTRDRYSISADLERLVEVSLERLAARSTELERGPFTLVHDDLHTQNFLIDIDQGADPRVIFLDWQDASQGHPVRDLCQLLGGDTRPDVQRQHGAVLLREYHRVLVQRGIDDWPYDQVLRDLPVAAARLALGYVRFLSEYAVKSANEQVTLDNEWQRMVTMLRVMDELD